MENVFPLKISTDHEIKNTQTFYNRPLKTSYKGTESSSYLTPKILKLILKSNKIYSLSSLKMEIT